MATPTHDAPPPFLLAAPTPAVIGTTKRNGGSTSSVSAAEVLGTADEGVSVVECASFDGGLAVGAGTGRGAQRQQTARAVAWMAVRGRSGSFFFFKKIDVERTVLA